MLAVVLALSASLCWGVADFVGGTFSRRLPAVVVVFALEGGGLLGVAAVLLAVGEGPPGARSIVFAALAGISGTLGLICLFRGMAIGAMAVVAPIFASGTAVIPVIVGLATGDTLGAVVAAGLALAAVGIVLASLEGEHEGGGPPATGRAALVFALVGACGAAGFVVGSDAASDGSVLWTLLVTRAAALPVVAVLIAAGPARHVRPERRDVLRIGAIGLVDLTATGLFGLATTKGALAIVAVLGAMYPVVTAGLARLVHDERVRAIQIAGAGCALVGVALVAAG